MFYKFTKVASFYFYEYLSFTLFSAAQIIIITNLLMIGFTHFHKPECDPKRASNSAPKADPVKKTLI